MIFKEIFKGTDLTFNITIEKTQYKPGEVVRGVLALKTEKHSKARHLTLFAEGKESTIIQVTESTGSNSSSSRSNTTTRTYTEINTFFLKDLSHLLQMSVRSNPLSDGMLEITPQNKEIAFDFTLPSDNLFSSYKGKHAKIVYTIKATADTAKRLDVNKEEHFSVRNTEGKVSTVYNERDTSQPDENNSKTAVISEQIDTSLIAKEKEGNAGKESYSARFERIFGKNPDRVRTTFPPNTPFKLGGSNFNIDMSSKFAKNREEFTNENSEARIELMDYRSIYTIGQTLRGKVILLQNQADDKKNKKIREMKITLTGIEYAFAQGVQRINTVEKYEEKTELDDGHRDDLTYPFEFQIPEDVNQSYTGKYSEYFWGLEAKLNRSWSSDVRARTIIDIV